jgi:esterase/lipase superfamily enzyme
LEPRSNALRKAIALQPIALAYFLLPAYDKRRWMKREYHRWYSHRLGMELGVIVYGHYGQPLLGFPTSAGDEGELEGQSMIGALSDFIDAGRLKFFTVNSINGYSFYNKGAHPFHRSYVQSVFDSYLREEVVPFIWDNCQSSGIAISTMGARSVRTTLQTACSSIPT